jgi:bla regulator protein blaR1
MIPSATAALNHISWAAVGKPSANHLWQSTLFAGVVALLTLALRKNSSRVRCALWFSASVKFLIPLALWIAMGSHLAQPRSPEPASHGFSSVMQEITEPFAPTVGAAALALSPHGSTAASGLLPAFLFAAWLCGCAAVLFLWWLQWRRVVAAVREGQLARAGREFQVLERLKQNRAIARRVDLAISRSALEPGIVGILRPIMLLPAGISDRLTDAQLEAILIHELCHVRRRDNLAAAVHMLVETIFWFYPPVWWIGARLVDERERACDEEVLKLGSEPQAYAEAILHVCEFYLESPLVCVPGVTGSNLKKRIEAIMIHRAASKLDLGKKMLLAAAGAVAVAAPLVIGLLNPTSSRAQSQPATAAASPVETVSIKPSTSSTNFIDVRRTANVNGPSEFTATGITLAQLLAAAYDVGSFQISGGPAWVNSAKYDVGITDPVGDRAMPDLQNALADRFKLMFHRETSELPGYDLVVASGGPKLTEVPAGNVTPEKSRAFLLPPGHMIATQLTMEEFARTLSGQTGRPVVDKTGLTGVYDFELDWTMTPPQPNQSGTTFPMPSPESVASLLKAVPDQLGLELKPQMNPVETLIIDSAEQVTGNE